MVFLTIFRNCSTMYARKLTEKCPKPDKYWKRSMYMRMMWRYYGRRQHIYSIGVRYANRALRYSTHSRPLKREYMKELWETRLEAACDEHGIQHREFLTLLNEADITLDRKVLTDLSIYEPRTFQCLTTFAKQRKDDVGIFDAVRPVPEGVVSHGEINFKLNKNRDKK